MATVAEQLRQAREAGGLTVLEIAEITKIRPDHLRALEEGNYRVFAAPVYIRGFVRTYVAFLKLDADRIIDQLNLELDVLDKNRITPLPRPRSSQIFNAVLLCLWRVPWRMVGPLLLLGAVILGVIYGWRAWTNRSSQDPLVTLGSGLYQPPQKGGGEVLPLPKPGPQ